MEVKFKVSVVFERHKFWKGSGKSSIMRLGGTTSSFFTPLGELKKECE